MFILLPPQPEHHTIRASLVTIILFHCRPTLIIHPHNNSYSEKLADHVSFTET
jgi:hypothetical protein